MTRGYGRCTRRRPRGERREHRVTAAAGVRPSAQPPLSPSAAQREPVTGLDEARHDVDLRPRCAGRRPARSPARAGSRRACAPGPSPSPPRRRRGRRAGRGAGSRRAPGAGARTPGPTGRGTPPRDRSRRGPGPRGRPGRRSATGPTRPREGRHPGEQRLLELVRGVVRLLLLRDGPADRGSRALALREGGRRGGSATPRSRRADRGDPVPRDVREALGDPGAELADGACRDPVPAGVAPGVRRRTGVGQQVAPGPGEQLGRDHLVLVALGDEDRHAGEPPGVGGDAGVEGRVP